MSYTPQAVAEYLRSLPKTTATAVQVTIGRTTYAGAIYSQTRELLPGCHAYDEGKREYEQRGFYLLGSLPASYLRLRKMAYLLDRDHVAFPARRWYVAGWFDKEPNEFHPFGKMFQLFPDDDGSIVGDYQGMRFSFRFNTSDLR